MFTFRTLPLKFQLQGMYVYIFIGEIASKTQWYCSHQLKTEIINLFHAWFKYSWWKWIKTEICTKRLEPVVLLFFFFFRSFPVKLRKLIFMWILYLLNFWKNYNPYICECFLCIIKSHRAISCNRVCRDFKSSVEIWKVLLNEIRTDNSQYSLSF